MAPQLSYAADENDPIVTVSPTGEALFDKPLPADTYFKLRFEPTVAAITSVVVRVWPFATKGTCIVHEDFAQLAGSRQFHELFMMRGTGEDKAFVARIPPLQVAQRFCVSLQSYTPIPDDVVEMFAKAVASDVATDLTPPASSGVASAAAKDVVRDAIARRLANKLKERYGNRDPDARAAAGVAAELVDMTLVREFIDAKVTYNANNAKINALKPEQVTPEIKAQLTALGTAAEKKQAELEAALVKALMHDTVKRELSSVRTTYGGSRAGAGQTATAANYAAIDTGIVAAFPLPYAGGNGNPWALPYVGLNLYLVPVDRTIPLSELVDQPLQRISLTIGRTLSSPTLTNRTVTDFGFGYPVVAGGYRLGQFVRATVGAVFYKVSDPNPTSANTTFGVAPFAGMALDGDVIAIAQGKLFAPK